MPECTKEHPMPTQRDQMGQHWVHVDAQPYKDELGKPVQGIRGTLYKCPHCEEMFYNLTSSDLAGYKPRIPGA